ncbi:hypothetical protein [Lentzea sp. NBRC 105346]|uniref:hypothetical protein n=1 Tax=Lentzea sp. NBRC 105346 TaxID=3032205 RepID=UPI0025561178|nr:hypothetical protein [Lentzea sp. NBRC 105346]
MKRAGLLALLVVASSVLTPAADAATGSATAKCTEGEFSGKFTLTYDIGTDKLRLKRGIGSAGPYIGDSGEMHVRVFYQDGPTENTVLRKSATGLRSDETGSVPVEGTKVPRSARSFVVVKFADSSGEKCTAKRELR